jgi:hypothetical protein
MTRRLLTSPTISVWWSCRFPLAKAAAVARRGKRTTSTTPSLHAEVPPTIQRTSGKVMTGTWVDPTDTAPSAARTPRLVKGFRRPCLLRFCRARHGDRSAFSAEHVAAADELRRIYDLARLGASGRKNPWVYCDVAAQPKLGPTVSEMAAYEAWREMGRVRKRITDADWFLLGWFVLESLSVNRWVEKEHRAGRKAYQKTVMQTLVRGLDTLVEHFGEVIRRHGVDLTA